MLSFFRKNYKFVLIFLFVFFALIFFGYNNTDIIWNYGFSHAIRMGEVPYRDFNIISTPLYAFLMSLGLFISDNYIVFIFEQALLCTLLFYVFSKMFPNRLLILLFACSFPLFYAFFPNYNFLALFLIVLLIYMDNNDLNDYLIGFVLGLLLLSKHTVGGCILICSLISNFSLKKSMKRIFGCIIPVLIFVCYLALNRALYNFLNLSIFGLFDFGGENGSFSVFYIILFLLLFGHLIYMLIKNKKDKSCYYLLGSLSFIVPICDHFHFNYLFVIYVVVILYRYNNIKYLKELSFVLLIFIVVFNFYLNAYVYKELKFSDMNHFKGYVTTRSFNNKLNSINNNYSSVNNSYMFSFYNMFFDIASNKKITYFDVPLYGNFGYDGVNNMKKRIDDMYDVYFYIQDNNNPQFCKDLYNYIKDTAELIESTDMYDVYYRK